MAILGCIGTGSMGSALIRAAARSGVWETLLLANRRREKAEKLSAEVGGEAVDNAETALRSDYLMLGVEPADLPGLLASLRPALERRNKAPVVVSMAAGVDLAALGAMLPAGTGVIRLMPNIPAAAGAGVILWCASREVTAEQRDLFLRGLAPAGAFLEVDEPRLKAAAGISGCGPAYCALFAEALADGGVACGVPRKEAAELAALTMLGAAKMLLEGGMTPAGLKDAVCSPGGSTIQGVRALEEGGMRAAVMNAVIAAFEKKF